MTKILLASNSNCFHSTVGSLFLYLNAVLNISLNWSVISSPWNEVTAKSYSSQLETTYYQPKNQFLYCFSFTKIVKLLLPWWSFLWIRKFCSIQQNDTKDQMKKIKKIFHLTCKSCLFTSILKKTKTQLAAKNISLSQFHSVQWIKINYCIQFGLTSFQLRWQPYFSCIFLNE